MRPRSKLLSCRGAVDPITLGVVVVVLGFGAKLAGWKPSEMFRRKPPTEQVTKLQTDLAKAQAEAEAARLQLAAAAAAERAKQEEQLRWSQQMGEGAADALRRLPVEKRTAETQLASDLLSRANFGLAAAIGNLPREKQAEIIAIVDKALSAVQAERDEARSALVAKDAELHALTIEREQVKAQIPVLQAQLETKAATARAVQAELTVKTSEVNAWAEKADLEKRQSATLGAALERWIIAAACLGGGWFFLAYLAPHLLKLLRPGRTKNFLRDTIGHLTGGQLYRDAKKKISVLKQPTT